jgi:hypothetical protein
MPTPGRRASDDVGRGAGQLRTLGGRRHGSQARRRELLEIHAQLVDPRRRVAAGLQVGQVEEGLFGAGDERALLVDEVREPIAGSQRRLDVTEGEPPQRRLSHVRTRGAATGDLRDVFRDRVREGERRQPAHVRPGREPVGDEKGMRYHLPVRRREREQPAPEPQQLAGCAPAAELRLQTRLRAPAAAEEAGLEHRLVRHDLEQLHKFHAANMP